MSPQRHRPQSESMSGISRQDSTPAEIPAYIRAFDADPKQLGIGKVGKTGLLELEFQRGHMGRTVIKKMYSQAPLLVQRVLQYDGDDNHCVGNSSSCGGGGGGGGGEQDISSPAYLYIMSTSGGILQGDRYRIDINVGKSARVHLTTQGATRIYSMNSNYATQMLNITVEDGGYLEFVPDQIIPYRNSRFYQEASLNVHSNATMIYAETIMPGRVAMGESFVYDACHLKTVATDHNGNYRLADIASITPKIHDVSSFGMQGRYKVMGSAYILTETRHVSELYRQISAAIASNKEIFGGVTVIKDDTGLLARILGENTEHVKDAILEMVRILREVVIGVPFERIRKS